MLTLYNFWARIKIVVVVVVVVILIQYSNILQLIDPFSLNIKQGSPSVG